MYDVTVTVGETVVATFVGRSKEIGGVVLGRRPDMPGEVPTSTRDELEALQLDRLRETLTPRPRHVPHYRPGLRRGRA